MAGKKSEGSTTVTLTVVNGTVVHNGVDYTAGEKIEVFPEEAERLIRLGVAVDPNAGEDAGGDPK